jgi:hypothetical protein
MGGRAELERAVARALRLVRGQRFLADFVFEDSYHCALVSPFPSPMLPPFPSPLLYPLPQTN